MVRLLSALLGIVLGAMAGLCGVATVLFLGGSGLGFWILSFGPFDAWTFLAAAFFGLVGLLMGLVATALWGAAGDAMDHALAPATPRTKAVPA